MKVEGFRAIGGKKDKIWSKVDGGKTLEYSLRLKKLILEKINSQMCKIME